MHIGKAIREIRRIKYFKQKELAKKCGMSANALCQIEKSRSYPNKENMENLCKVLGITPAFLIFYALDEQDIDINKREVYKLVAPVLKKLMEQLVS